MNKLVSALFPKAAELEAANKRIEELEADKEDLTRRNVDWSQRAGRADKRSDELQDELTKVKTKLREQNDADLLLVSAKIILDTLKGEKPKASDLAMQQNLRQQRQAMDQRMGMSGSLGGGLGGIFGSVFGYPFEH